MSVSSSRGTPKTLRAWALAGLLLPAVVSGCTESLTNLNCPDRGCANGLRLTFDSPLPDGTIVTLELGEVPWTVVCGSDVDCSESLFFEDLRSEFLVVRVRTGSSESRYTIEPAYGVQDPDGPHCPGECHYAEVAIPPISQRS